MQKVLYPGYFPIFTYPGQEDFCNFYPDYWRDFTLEQAMAAYWKVKSWNFSFSNYFFDDPFLSGGSASVQLNVDADKMSDLVCYTDSNASGSGSGNVFSLSANVRPDGLNMSVTCKFNSFSYNSAYSFDFDPSPVTIIIGDETIASAGFFGSSGFSADIIITATSFF